MTALLGLDTTLKKGIFCMYVLLWVSSHLLVYASKLAGAPDYNVTSVVLLTEAIKLMMAVALYLWNDGDATQMPQYNLENNYYRAPILLLGPCPPTPPQPL